jgi:hypothetical protein
MQQMYALKHFFSTERRPIFANRTIPASVAKFEAHRNDGSLDPSTSLLMNDFALAAVSLAERLVSDDCQPMMIKVIIPTTTSIPSGRLKDVYHASEFVTGLRVMNPAKKDTSRRKTPARALLHSIIITIS